MGQKNKFCKFLKRISCLILSIFLGLSVFLLSACANEKDSPYHLALLHSNELDSDYFLDRTSLIGENLCNALIDNFGITNDLVRDYSKIFGLYGLKESDKIRVQQELSIMKYATFFNNAKVGSVEHNIMCLAYRPVRRATIVDEKNVKLVLNNVEGETQTELLQIDISGTIPVYTAKVKLQRLVDGAIFGSLLTPKTITANAVYRVVTQDYLDVCYIFVGNKTFEYTDELGTTTTGMSFTTKNEAESAKNLINTIYSNSLNSTATSGMIAYNSEYCTMQSNIMCKDLSTNGTPSMLTFSRWNFAYGVYKDEKVDEKNLYTVKYATENWFLESFDGTQPPSSTIKREYRDMFSYDIMIRIYVHVAKLVSKDWASKEIKWNGKTTTLKKLCDNCKSLTGILPYERAYDQKGNLVDEYDYFDKNNLQNTKRMEIIRAFSEVFDLSVVSQYIQSISDEVFRVEIIGFDDYNNGKYESYESIFGNKIVEILKETIVVPEIINVNDLEKVGVNIIDTLAGKYGIPSEYNSVYVDYSSVYQVYDEYLNLTSKKEEPEKFAILQEISVMRYATFFNNGTVGGATYNTLCISHNKYSKSEVTNNIVEYINGEYKAKTCLEDLTTGEIYKKNAVIPAHHVYRQLQDNFLWTPIVTKAEDVCYVFVGNNINHKFLFTTSGYARNSLNYYLFSPLNYCIMQASITCADFEDRYNSGDPLELSVVRWNYSFGYIKQSDTASENKYKATIDKFYDMYDDAVGKFISEYKSYFSDDIMIQICQYVLRDRLSSIEIKWNNKDTTIDKALKEYYEQSPIGIKGDVKVGSITLQDERTQLLSVFSKEIGMTFPKDDIENIIKEVFIKIIIGEDTYNSYSADKQNAIFEGLKEILNTNLPTGVDVKDVKDIKFQHNTYENYIKMFDKNDEELKKDEQNVYKNSYLLNSIVIASHGDENTERNRSIDSIFMIFEYDRTDEKNASHLLDYKITIRYNEDSSITLDKDTDKTIFDINDFVDGIFYVNLNQLFKDKKDGIVIEHSSSTPFDFYNGVAYYNSNRTGCAWHYGSGKDNQGIMNPSSYLEIVFGAKTKTSRVRMKITYFRF